MQEAQIKNDIDPVNLSFLGYNIEIVLYKLFHSVIDQIISH